MPTSHTPEITTSRRYDLDWLRILAVFMLIPYHSSRIFDIWEYFYVKNPQTSIALTVIRAVLDPWGMPLLFVISGASAWLAMRRRSSLSYLKERVLRLIIPLVFGLIIVVPPQAYLAWLGQGNTGSFWEFYRGYWIIHNPDLGNWVGDFTLGHLWFILFLFLFSLIALPIFIFIKGRLGTLVIDWLSRICKRSGSIFLFFIPFWFSEMLPGPSVGGVNIFAYLMFLIAGFVLWSDERIQSAIDHSWRWAFYLGALTLGIISVVRFAGIQFVDFSWQSTLFDAVKYFTTWAWVIGLLGFGHRYLNRANRWLPGLSASAYPFYILHQTVIVLIGFYVVRWDIGIFPKYLIIFCSSLVITLGLCDLFRRWSVTRVIFGIKFTPSSV